MEKLDQGQEHGLHGVICHYPTPYCRGDQKILTLIAEGELIKIQIEGWR